MQLWGLVPGFHRLTFEDGHVLLTLCIGDVGKLLRQQEFQADSVTLQFDASGNVPNGAPPLYLAKSIARLCKVGTLLTASCDEVMQSALTQCGFVFASGLGEVKAVYSPTWVTKKRPKSVNPGSCVVIGAGLAGAAVASSLARRGWAVTVLDAASQPASGASSLPAGLLALHTSPDDSPLSRLSRAGIRMTLQQARALLRHGIDWGQTGVLQRGLSSDGSDLPLGVPPEWFQSLALVATEWCRQATPRTLAAAALPPSSTALWHAKGGWLKPGELVTAWMNQPGITWRGSTDVAALLPDGDGWQALDAAGHTVARADMVVLAAGYASQMLAASAGTARPELQAIRGQVTFGLHQSSNPLPPFAVNGHGSLITHITTPDGPMWLIGAGYERDVYVPNIKHQDHADNLTRLQKLLPDSARALADQFSPEHARGWAGIRCATPNRLPRVGRVDSGRETSGLWLCTGMGSRGLSFAALSAELLAAQLHGEPFPVDKQLAMSMSVSIQANASGD